MSEDGVGYGSTAVQVAPQGGAVMTIKGIADRVNLVHQVLAKVMRDGTHYGKVPGCGDKRVLLKPGADVLAMTFRLVPQFLVTRADLPDGHREYDVTCSMYGPDGGLLGQGVGSASTMEKKYRYRKGPKGERIENEDIADVYNTVLKIAKKRAHIDATLTVTGAADLFTQDLIDDDEPQREPVKMPTAAAPKAEPPAAKPQPAATAPAEGELVAIGPLEAVSVKESKPDAAKPWKKWGCKVNGEWYGTFDSEIGEFAETLKGERVRAVYTTDAKGYHNLSEIGAAMEDEGNTQGGVTPF